MSKHPLLPGPCHSHPKAQVPWPRSRISRGSCSFSFSTPSVSKETTVASQAHPTGTSAKPRGSFHLASYFTCNALSLLAHTQAEGPSMRAGFLETLWKQAKNENFCLTNVQSSVWVCPSCAHPSARGEPAFLEQPFSQGNAKLMVAGVWEGGLFSWRLFSVRELGLGSGSAGALGDCQHSMKTALCFLSQMFPVLPGASKLAPAHEANCVQTAFLC